MRRKTKKTDSIFRYIQKMILFFRYFLILILTLGLGCQQSSENQAALEETPAAPVYENCLLDAQTVGECLVASAGLYVYATQFGGRATVVSSNITAANTGALSYSLSEGWYSGVTASFSDADLIAANIRSGVQIFGVTGTLDPGTTPNSCSVAGAVLADCTASTNRYVYAAQYGGRTAVCADIDNGVLNNNCYITETGVSVSDGPATALACTAQGKQLSVCKANTNEYNYTSSYGGRSLVCSSGFNASPCWLADASGGTPKTVTTSSNACADNVLNASSCTTQPSRYVYATEYGGRTTICTDDNVGTCYISAASKAGLDSDLIADNLAGGKSVFGVTGSFYGSGDWASAAHRNLDTAQIGFQAEIGTYAGTTSKPLPAGYRVVPQVSRDDDGYTQVEVQNVERAGWGSAACGTTGSLSDRINDCAAEFGVNARWIGGQNGNAGQGSWKLVTRLGANESTRGKEVWLDERTGLLWSSLVSTELNWCKASGSNNASDADVAAGFKQNDPNDICDNASYQSTGLDPVSACAELEAVPATEAGIFNAGKGNLAASDAVYWRLPTLYDFEIAEYNGLRFVLPDAGVNGGREEWTATTSSSSSQRAWTYNSSIGTHVARDRGTGFAVRCIGRGTL